MVLSLAFAGPAQAHPEGAPWDNVGTFGREDCTACHFDGEAVIQSPAIRVTGLDERIEPARRYMLTLALEDVDAPRAGFVMRAETKGADGAPTPAGHFLAGDDRTETGDADETAGAIRSTLSGSQAPNSQPPSSQAPSSQAPGAHRWVFTWVAPASLAPQMDIIFSIAANASNDDESPFGDQIHRAEIRRPARQ